MMTNLITSSMNRVLQLGDRIFPSTEILSLLSEYQLLPLLIKEIFIDEAIAEIVCTPEEEQLVSEQLAQQHQ